MPIEEITRYLHAGAGAGRRSLHMTLAIHCAPFLKGLKESALVTLPRGQALELAGLAADAGLNWYFLFHEDGRDMVFLYRREGFQRYLRWPEVERFLTERGYFEKDGSEAFLACRILGELSRRMERYFHGEADFPHEVGVLLGYPTADVEDYIRLGGRDCLLVGYWKVYHDVQRAKKTFAAFDEARERTVREVLEGKELYQLCGRCAS
ncbi:MAG TPA: DUF3793 family protein [Candidatus Eisenbergiella merdavium]|uniref:DUF3793 family protein n=1 Tax=Candidatus Eisenbergiella merdavium TaxID=2838551 RepID=A0A9D2SRU7_9FIRM|nr:DUF3793 family protein [Candidatus Eisenbergiella merdavium]